MNEPAVVAAAVAFSACLWSSASRRARASGMRLHLHEPISLAFVAIPIAMVASGWPSRVDATAGCVLICAGVCAATDRQTGYIFDGVVAWTLCAIVVASCFEGTLVRSLTGAGLCSSLLLALHYATRRSGLGLGDVKLGAVIGALGVLSGTVALASAFVLGGAAALAGLIMRRVRAGDRIRFGPYLAAGTWMCIALRDVSR
jgi:leader peptidase (prepilin peptidase) / N-methyltransferase